MRKGGGRLILLNPWHCGCADYRIKKTGRDLIMFLKVD